LRVSEHFKLGRRQPELDFVDVDVESDLPVFLDPRALLVLPPESEWGAECVSLVQNFFDTVLSAIRSGDDDRARSLLEQLREPNETHLGLSKGHSRGRALGTESAHDVWDALRQSEAVKSGLLQDLEDTILMVEGVGSDIVSDITTNILREPLVNYTRDVCTAYGIPMKADVDCGPMWDPTKRDWYSELGDLPVTPFGRLILVPKVLVRRQMHYDPGEYFNHYLLDALAADERRARSSLVQVLKNGNTRVTKKSLREKYGTGKKVIVEQTRTHPEVLERYRGIKAASPPPPLTHAGLADHAGVPAPDWDALLDAVTTVPKGGTAATRYHHAVQDLLTALFYPSLAHPVREQPLHGGRKRVDIRFTNVARHGFFNWLATHYTAPFVYVECKNYTGEVNNPELDQLSGRFSKHRGEVGLLVCRRIKNKDLFMQSCRDTADDGRGFIIALDDNDLRSLVDEARRADDSDGYRVPLFDLLRERFEALVM